MEAMFFIQTYNFGKTLFVNTQYNSEYIPIISLYKNYIFAASWSLTPATLNLLNPQAEQHVQLLSWQKIQVILWKILMHFEGCRKLFMLRESAKGAASDRGSMASSNKRVLRESAINFWSLCIWASPMGFEGGALLKGLLCLIFHSKGKEGRSLKIRSNVPSRRNHFSLHGIVQSFLRHVAHQVGKTTTCKDCWRNHPTIYKLHMQQESPQTLARKLSGEIHM